MIPSVAQPGGIRSPPDLGLIEESDPRIDKFYEEVNGCGAPQAIKL